MSAIGPGDWVECVDVASPRPGWEWPPGERLTLGAIYQVGGCWIEPLVGVPVVSIVGHERVITSAEWGYRVGYAATRFRPLWRDVTEIAQSLLQPAPSEREPQHA